MPIKIVSYIVVAKVAEGCLEQISNPIEPCTGTMHVKRIEKNYCPCFALTKDAAINYFIDRKLGEQIQLSEKIKKNQSNVKQAEEMLKEVLK